MTLPDKNLAISAPEKDPEWQQIVEKIVDELGDELPDKVILATEYLIAGWPTYKAARALRTKPETVRLWLKKYPAMAAAVANGRKLLTQWRMARLEQQFVTAVEVSEEILGTDLSGEGVNAKVLAAVGLHTRYIISLFAGQKIDVNVKTQTDDQTMKAKADALDYIVKGLAEQRDRGDVIDTTFVTVTESQKDTSPVLDPEGNSRFGEVGILDTNNEGSLCHICGERHVALSAHILKAHRMSAKDYELVFMLPPGELMRAKKEGLLNNAESIPS